MTKTKHWLKKHRAALILICVIIALFFSVYYFILSIQKTSSEGALRPVYYYHRDDDHGQIEKRSQQLSVNDIQEWMTFDYINFVFKLPSDYLKKLLGITDSRYPNVRLDSYARDAQMDPGRLVDIVKNYVTTYTPH